MTEKPHCDLKCHLCWCDSWKPPLWGVYAICSAVSLGTEEEVTQKKVEGRVYDSELLKTQAGNKPVTRLC